MLHMRLLLPFCCFCCCGVLAPRLDRVYGPLGPPLKVVPFNFAFLLLLKPMLLGLLLGEYAYIYEQLALHCPIIDRFCL